MLSYVFSIMVAYELDVLRKNSIGHARTENSAVSKL